MNKNKSQTPIVRYTPIVEIGLLDDQVKERLKNNLVNKTKSKCTKSYFSIFTKNIFTFFNLLWLIIFVALLWVGAYADLIFIIVVALNTCISIIQECKAKVTVERLSLVTVPKIITIRNGKEEKIPSTKLVLDDIIKLSNGNAVPSDSIILSGDIEVNESLLTGESKPIKKTTGDLILEGSFLISGVCYAKIEKIGVDNYIQQVAKEAKKFKSPASNLFKSLNNLIRYISFIIIPVGLLMLLKEFFLGDNISEAIKATSASLVGMIPAGMYLLITVALAVGVIKLSKRTLVQNIYSIEMLARSNVLCLDKTGTITDGTMKLVEQKVFTENAIEVLKEVLSKQQTTNSTSSALLSAFGNSNNYALKSKLEFSSSRKYSLTNFEEKGIFALGAPTFLKLKMDKETEQLITSYTKQGLRVLALCKLSKEIELDQDIPEKNILLALFAIEDHIRDDAIETIKWFKDNGVEIKIISGDDPVAVSTIARRVGINNSDKCISLENVSLKQVEQIALEYTVFGRVSPEQKQVIVKALRNSGKVVAMTGDGVNDTLALKEADCSIAMADGSDAARSLSNLVLRDSKFSSLPGVVKQGRQVINNIQQSSTLFLMKTIFTIVLSLLTIATMTNYPFTPKHLFMLEALIIGFPSFILALQPNSKLISGDFLPVVLRRSLPRAMLMLGNVFFVVILGTIGHLEPNEVSTLATLIVTVTGFLNLFRLCLPLNLLKSSCLAISGIGIILGCSLMSNFFGLTNFSLKVGLWFFGLTIFSALCIWLIPIAFDKFIDIIDRSKPKFRKKMKNKKKSFLDKL